MRKIEGPTVGRFSVSGRTPAAREPRSLAWNLSTSVCADALLSSVFGAVTLAPRNAAGGFKAVILNVDTAGDDSVSAGGSSATEVRTVEMGSA